MIKVAAPMGWRKRFHVNITRAHDRIQFARRSGMIAYSLLVDARHHDRNVTVSKFAAILNNATSE